MEPSFTTIDWAILAAYVGALALVGWWSSRGRGATARDYFLAGNATPAWLAAVSVLSTTQSAATFLGGPDFGFRGDYTYLTSFLGALAAAVLVARVLIPRFYAMGATTVYELLEARHGPVAKQAAGAMYLVGRVFAAGARLYMAAIAVSMVVFLEVTAETVLISSLLLLVLGVAFTFFGGLNTVVWTDLLQVVLYVGAAILTLVFLRVLIPVDDATLFEALRNAPPDGTDKLALVDLSLGLDRPFSILAIFTGVLLLYAANYGMDQDTSQRLLACKDSKGGARALYGSVLISMPVVWLFIAIGSLLHVFYERPDLMSWSGEATRTFEGQTITVFMSFILSEIPPGLRGLIVVGVVAAAAINAGLNSMASVIVEDFYRPWRMRRGPATEAHYVAVGRWSMVGSGLALFFMSIVCFHWQRASDMPLLPFALSVMTFAYAGLIGVYATTVFTTRGSTASILAAFAVGFVAVLALQPYVAEAIGLPAALQTLAFPFQLVLGSALAFLTCVAGKGKPAPA